MRIPALALPALLALTFPLAAQGPAQARDPINAELPEWLELDVGQRVRIEGLGDIQFNEADDDVYTLSRLHLGVGLQPNRWFRVYAQAQDARARGVDEGFPRPTFKDSFDLRQGFIVVGDERNGWWDVKVGRQELIFGSERLLGINRWANTPRSWDAAKVALHRGEDRVDFFASSVVVVDPEEFDEPRDGVNIHGAYASLGSLLRGHVVEPHLLWRTNPRAANERGGVGEQDTYTLGFRLARKPAGRWGYETELDWQFGDIAGDELRAFMGMGQMSFTFEEAAWRPRLLAEYTFASGDERRGDGRIGTFDQLLTRAHRIWGIVDQVGGRNSKIFQTGVRAHPTESLELRLDHYFYWLANRHDALYRHNGRLWVPAVPGGARSTYVGDEWDAQAIFQPSPYLTFAGGVARLFRGGFLQEAAGPGAPLLIYASFEFGI